MDGDPMLCKDCCSFDGRVCRFLPYEYAHVTVTPTSECFFDVWERENAVNAKYADVFNETCGEQM